MQPISVKELAFEEQLNYENLTREQLAEKILVALSSSVVKSFYLPISENTSIELSKSAFTIADTFLKQQALQRLEKQTKEQTARDDVKPVEVLSPVTDKSLINEMEEYRMAYKKD